MKIFGKFTKWTLIAITGFLLYFPILMIMFFSVNESSGFTRFTGFSLKWFGEIFTNPTLSKAIANTLQVSITSTIIATIIGTLIAIGIHSLSSRKRRTLMNLNSIPMVNADIVTAVSLMVIFTFLGIKFGFATMLLSHIFFSIPFIIVNVMPRLRMLDKDLYFASLDLGASKSMTLVKVIIPAIKEGIIAGALIAFTMSIDDFVISWFNTGNGFSNFSIWIYSNLNKRGFEPSAHAYNTLITIITMALIGFVNIRKINKMEKLKKLEIQNRQNGNI